MTAEEGYEEIVGYFVSKGADASIQDSDGVCTWGYTTDHEGSWFCFS